MVRKWTLGGTGFALLATAFVVAACSSKDGDDDDTGNGTGAKGGSAPMAGKGGGAGTSTTGGTGGTGGGTGGGTTGGTGGTTGGTGGGTTGGSAGAATGGTAGGAMAGAGGAMGFDCSMPAAATCNFISNWNVYSMTSQFQGTYSYQETTIMVDKMTDPTKMHITGTVSNYDGFGIYTGKCSSLTGYTGVSFKLSGTTSSVDKPNALKFVVQMNATEAIDTMNKKGMCVGDPGVDCISPNVAVTPSDMEQTIMFADMMGGKPVAAVDVTQILGFQWQIDPDASKTPFAIDLTLSDFKLLGGSGTPVDCSMGTGGMGAGGASSGGASSGGASSGGAGAGGAAAGSAGAAMGGAGAGGASGGQGGQSGGRGGRGGGAGAP